MDSKAYLQRRIDYLEQITNQPNAADNMYAEYVYETYLADQYTTMYLPSTMTALILASVEEPAYRKFANIWAVFASRGWSRITDGVPLNILEVATVWLGKGMEPPYLEPFKVFAGGITLSPSDREKAIEEIIDTEIIPVLDMEASTSMVFTRINMISTAIRLNSIIQNGLKSQGRQLSALRSLEEEFFDLEPLEAYDDEIEEITYVMELLENGGEIIRGFTRQLDIFDQVRVSPMLPFCIANLDEYKVGKDTFQSTEKRWFKAYSKGEADLQRYDDFKWVSDAKSLCIIFYVYMGDEDPTLASANDFARVIYSFKKGLAEYGKCSVTMKATNIDIVRERLNAHLNTFQVNIPQRSEDQLVFLRQRFFMPNIQIDDNVFMFMCSTTPSIATLLRFNEQDVPWSQKAQIAFGVYLFGDIELRMIGQEVKVAAQIVKKGGVMKSLSKGTKLIKFTLKTQNYQQYELIKFFALRLMRRYIEEYQSIYDLNASFFPLEKRIPIEPMVVLGAKAKKKQDDEVKNIKKLARVDPLLWKFANYSRPVAPKVELQVTPIQPNEVEVYRNMGRDVILWPVNVIGIPDEMQTKPSIDPATGNPLRVFYTTLTAEKPHIVLVPNPGPNKDNYPMIPKCQESISDMTIDPVDWSITIHSKERGKTPKDPLKTLKILDVGRVGPINGSLLQYLNVKSMERLGVERSQSSFLHCALYALDSDPSEPSDFRYMFNKPGAENHVIQVRRELGRYAAACLQENPDMSVAEIEAELIDHKKFLDPSRHYRAVEEFLGVNIFVASADQNKELLLEAPAFKEFYTRSKRRPLYGCMIILKLTPQQSKINREYQCELLFTQTPDGPSAIFNSEISDKLESAVDSLTKHLIVKPVSHIVSKGDEHEMRQDISVQISAETKIAIPPAFIKMITAQSVDSFGKLRAVKVEPFWMLTPPLEPLCSLNVGDDDDLRSSAFPLDVVTLSSQGQIKSINDYFARLNAAGIQVRNIAYTPRGDKLVGIWFEIFNMPVYIPLSPIKWYAEKFTPVKFEDPFNVLTGESPTQKLARLQKVLMVYIQIIKRTFALYWTSEPVVEKIRKTNLGPFDWKSQKQLAHSIANDFMEAYVVVRKPDELQTVVGGDRFIPPTALESVDDLLAHFEEQFPTLFTRNQDNDILLICESQEFFENLAERLRNYSNEIIRELRTTRNKATPEGNSQRLTGFQPFLDHYYVCPADFKVHDRHQSIFMSAARYQLELKSQLESKPLLVTNINPVFIGRTAPYYFMYDGGSLKALFLIQNVLDGNASRATTLVKYWAQNLVNTGFYTPAYLGTVDVAVLQAPNFTIKDPNEPMIVRYQTGEYAALLSLNQTD